MRGGAPGDVLSFNQVNGVPRGFAAARGPGSATSRCGRRTTAGATSRGSGAERRRRPAEGDTLAIYPPVWDGDASAALRTVVLTEAIATTLGAGMLIWGDDRGVLRHPYYVDHERLMPAEARRCSRWHRFGLRCRDLFRGGTDTSWYELGDENAAVTVAWDGARSPEPVGGALFARVVRDGEDRSSSACSTSPAAPTARGRPATGRRQLHAGRGLGARRRPRALAAQSAVLGADDGRGSSPSRRRVGAHREGRAVACRVPLVDGWSVLRLGRHRERRS